MIAPIFPHLAEEAWEKNGGVESIFNETYPSFDRSKVKEDSVSIAIQINGKLRGSMEVEKTIKKDDLLDIAKTQENVKFHLKDKNIIEEIVVPERLINFVVK